MADPVAAIEGAVSGPSLKELGVIAAVAAIVVLAFKVGERVLAKKER